MVGSVAAFGANSWRGTLLADITPGTPPSDILPVSLSQFPSLLDGSTPSIQLQLSTVPEIIMINRESASGSFYVLNSRCTHQGCTVDKFDVNYNIACPCHGSVYSIDGSLQYGAEGPNQPPLDAYNFTFDGNDLLLIEVPGLNLKINSLSVESAAAPGSKRVRLSFPGREGCEYQVGYSTDIKTWTEPVMLSTTATGQANQPKVTSPNNTQMDVWVDSTSSKGFYRIGLVLADYG